MESTKVREREFKVQLPQQNKNKKSHPAKSSVA